RTFPSHVFLNHANRFRVLVDGTFCNAALAYKINLREQLPKYLGGDVEIVTTKCVLAELERLGSPVYGALVICRQFTVDMCPHMPHRSPIECLAHLARRAAKGNTKYIVATNVSVDGFGAPLSFLKISGPQVISSREFFL
ncbi:hypothetical protein ANCCAN_11318, partial [Ancylostoma caninum]